MAVGTSNSGQTTIDLRFSLLSPFSFTIIFAGWSIFIQMEKKQKKLLHTPSKRARPRASTPQTHDLELVKICAWHLGPSHVLSNDDPTNQPADLTKGCGHRTLPCSFAPAVTADTPTPGSDAARRLCNVPHPTHRAKPFFEFLQRQDCENLDTLLVVGG